MIHLKPLSGTPHHEEGMLEEALEKARKDAIALDQGGADGCLIQTPVRVDASTKLLVSVFIVFAAAELAR